MLLSPYCPVNEVLAPPTTGPTAGVMALSDCVAVARLSSPAWTALWLFWPPVCLALTVLPVPYWALSESLA